MILAGTQRLASLSPAHNDPTAALLPDFSDSPSVCARERDSKNFLLYEPRNVFSYCESVLDLTPLCCATGELGSGHRRSGASH
jgi:hypothetical protein